MTHENNGLAGLWRELRVPVRVKEINTGTSHVIRL
jgi:hypothetical protein